MELRFAPLSLASLGSLQTEVLCLPVFSDERPPRGALGLVDWRLCGRVSELLVSEVVSGAFDEALLMPPPARLLAAERLLLLGAGQRTEADPPRVRALLERLVARLLALRVRTAAFALPHGTLRWLAPEQAIDLLLEVSAASSGRFDELVVVDTEAAQRAMEPRIEYARRRAVSDL